jgi:hypothetical protein
MITSVQLQGCSALTGACSRRRVTSLSQRPCRAVRVPATVLCRRRDPERRSPTRRVFRVESTDCEPPPDLERRAPSRRLAPPDNPWQMADGRMRSAGLRPGGVLTDDHPTTSLLDTEGNSGMRREQAKGNEAGRQTACLLAGFRTAWRCVTVRAVAAVRRGRASKPLLSLLPSVSSGPFCLFRRRRRDGARRSNSGLLQVLALHSILCRRPGRNWQGQSGRQDAGPLRQAGCLPLHKHQPTTRERVI